MQSFKLRQPFARIINFFKYSKYKYFEEVPESERTFDLCLHFVKRDVPTTLFYRLPDKHKNYEICLEAVKRQGYCISAVPPECRTPDVRLAAVKQNGSVISLLKADWQTYELCKIAVLQDGFNLFGIKEDKRIPELISIAVRQAKGRLDKCGYNLVSLLNLDEIEKLCEFDASASGTGYADNNSYKAHLAYRMHEHIQPTHSLNQIPPLIDLSKLSQSDCLNAVEKDGAILFLLNKEQLTPYICMAGVKNNGLAIWALDSESLTEEICVASVQHNHHALKRIKGTNRTPLVCLEAIKKNYRSVYLLSMEEKKQALKLASALNVSSVESLLLDNIWDTH